MLPLFTLMVVDFRKAYSYIRVLQAKESLVNVFEAVVVYLFSVIALDHFPREERFPMKYRVLAAALVVALCNTSTVSAGPVIAAKVTYTGTYGDGRLFVGLDTQIQEPGCPYARFDIPAGHPSIKTWTAIALVAAATGQVVQVATQGCIGGFPTMSPGTNSYFYLSAN